jgi:hypothetical protein
MTKARIAVTAALYAFGLAALGGAIMYDNSPSPSPTSASTAPAMTTTPSPSAHMDSGAWGGH